MARELRALAGQSAAPLLRAAASTLELSELFKTAPAAVLSLGHRLTELGRKTMEQRLSLVTLGVADLERALRFYEGLGWRRGNQHAEVVFFQLAAWCWGCSRGGAGRRRRARRRKAAASAASRWLTTRASRAEVDAVLAEAERAGARS